MRQGKRSHSVKKQSQFVQSHNTLQSLVCEYEFLEISHNKPNNPPRKNPKQQPQKTHHKPINKGRSESVRNPPKPVIASKPSNYNPTPPDVHTEEGRKKIAQETMKMIEVNKKDTNLNYKASIGETIYPNHYDNFMPKPKNQHKCQIVVLPYTSFGVAKHLIQRERLTETCVLNFASATKPGGGFLNGRNAQEESLSRQSSLYYSLKESNSPMYRQKDDNYYQDFMIYSKRVHVFRNDRDENILAKGDQFFVNVITSAAPFRAKIEQQKGSHLSQTELRKLNDLLYHRCKKIVLCAIDKGNEALVLGSFGCGVFGNDPKDVSEIFHRILVTEKLEKHFQKVVFAIPGEKSTNFKAFKATFP